MGKSSLFIRSTLNDVLRNAGAAYWRHPMKSKKTLLLLNYRLSC